MPNDHRTQRGPVPRPDGAGRRAAMEMNAADPTSVGIPDELVAERLGMSVEEVQRHVRALVDLGFIRMEQR